jgi:hypothetical protein
MEEAYDTDILTFEGRKFEVKKFSDYDRAPPWDPDWDEGQGIVTYRRSRSDKKPGERLLAHDRGGDSYYYDFAATMQKAKEQGWGISGEDRAKLREKLGREPTEGEIRVAAVEANMQHLRGYIMEHWWWIGVSVRIIGPDGEPQGDDYEHALWGVESEGDYWKEVAADLAGEILHERRKAWRAALKEARQRRYWEARGVMTVAPLAAARRRR